MTTQYFRYGEAEVEYLRSKDKKLAAVMDRIGHIDRAVDTDLFACVVHNIVGQQISSKALNSIWTAMEADLGEITAATILACGRERLQVFGTTWRKVDYIMEFAEKVADGRFDLDAVAAMPDEEAIAALCSLKGIGVWTAEMLLLFCLQRPNVLSFGDLAIVRGMRMVYRHRAISREQFERYRRRLSPCGSVASLYFWAVAGGAIPELTDPGATKAAAKAKAKAKAKTPPAAKR